MQGCAPASGSLTSLDPVERQSSKIAAVACFFPPTDFLNYGKKGEVALGVGVLKDFKAPFDFHELDSITRSFNLVADEAKRRSIGKKISPVNHVTKDSAPALIIHGDADTLVPIQQAELIIAKMKENKVPCELVVRKGAGHGGVAFVNDEKIFADWFDKYLLEKK
jgi:acetyl esterase/lipase